MSDDELLLFGSIISTAMLHLFGFGPSRLICDEFAKKVAAEAESVHATISFP